MQSAIIIKPNCFKLILLLKFVRSGIYFSSCTSIELHKTNRKSMDRKSVTTTLMSEYIDKLCKYGYKKNVFKLLRLAQKRTVLPESGH